MRTDISAPSHLWFVATMELTALPSPHSRIQDEQGTIGRCDNIAIGVDTTLLSGGRHLFLPVISHLEQGEVC